MVSSRNRLCCASSVADTSTLFLHLVLGCVVKVINIDGGGEDGKLFYFNNDTTYGELFRDACSFHSIKEELFQFTVAKGTETQMIIAEDRLSTYKVREMCNWLLDNDCKIDIILHRKKEHENDQHIGKLLPPDCAQPSFICIYLHI